MSYDAKKIMVIGAFTSGSELAKTLVKTWVKAEYIPGRRSEPKVQRINDYDKANSK